MSKALVIKGANFTANKIETIVIEESIPCTSIVLSEESVQFSAIGETRKITATVAPVDTTDSIQWLSSNEDVAVVTNGSIECVGVGTAVVTAICGERTAYCDVTSTVTINADSIYSHTNGLYADGTDLAASPVKDYVNAKSNDRGRVYFSATNVLDGKLAYGGGSGTVIEGAYPMPIPNGASHITITKPEHAQYLRLVCLNSQEAPTNTVAPRTEAKVVAHVYLTSGTTAELDIPDTADSFAFGLYAASGYTGEQITGAANVLFT